MRLLIPRPTARHTPPLGRRTFFSSTAPAPKREGLRSFPGLIGQRVHEVLNYSTTTSRQADFMLAIKWSLSIVFNPQSPVASYSVSFAHALEMGKVESLDFVSGLSS
jgi:hypothetical protein